MLKELIPNVADAVEASLEKRNRREWNHDNNSSRSDVVKEMSEILVLNVPASCGGNTDENYDIGSGEEDITKEADMMGPTKYRWLVQLRLRSGGVIMTNRSYMRMIEIAVHQSVRSIRRDDC